MAAPGFSWTTSGSSGGGGPGTGFSWVDRPAGGGGGGGGRRKKKKGGGHGFFGHLKEAGGNLVSGVETAAHGVIPSIETLGTSAYQDLKQGGPVAQALQGHIGDSALYKNVIRPNAKAMGYMYAPLVHGHFGEFLHRAEDNPLQPLLDTITLASLGLGRVAAVALTPAELGSEARLTAALTGRYGGPAQEIRVHAADFGQDLAVRTLPRAGYRAGRMVLTDKLLKSLDPNTRVIGEFARAARQVQRQALPTELRHMADERYTEYVRSWNALNRDERVATNLLARLPLERDLDAWHGQLQEVAQYGTPKEARTATATLKLLDRPGVREAYRAWGQDTKQGDRITRAHAAGEALAQAREEIYARIAPKHVGSFDAAPFRHTLVARGAHILNESLAGKILRGIDQELEALGKGKAKAVRTARHSAGKQEVKQATKTANRLALAASRMSTYRAKLGPLAATTDRLSEEFNRLKAEHDTLANMEPDPPTSMQQAFERATRPEGEAAPAVDPTSGEMRLQMLGDLRDRMDEVQTARQKALAAEHGHANNLYAAGHVARAQGMARRELDAAREERIAMLQTLRERWGEFHRQQHELLADRANIEAHVGKLWGGPTIDQIRHEIRMAGRPMPYYVKDMPSGRRGEPLGIRKTGGLTPPAHDIRQSHHLLYRMGMLALDQSNLNRPFLNAVQFDFRRDLHERARDLAAKVENETGLPQGYRWLREVRGERIPHTETQAGEHAAGGHQVFPEEYKPLTGKDLPEDDIARDEQGYRLAVPEAFARQLEGEWKRSSTAKRLMLDKPLQFWRALVLHTNPQWLINNVF